MTVTDAKLSVRRQAYHFLDPTDGMTRREWLFNALLTSLIVLTIVTTMLSTVPGLTGSELQLLRMLELIAAVFFAGEYALRLWVVPERRHVAGHPAHFRDYLQYALSPLALIDLLVILALLSPASLPLGALRGLRLLKLVGVLKLGRYSEALQVIGRVLRQRSGELMILTLIVLVLVFIAASVLYQIESRAGTKGFESIPQAMWWSIVTLCTVGYGDVYPSTPLGRLTAGFIMLLSLGMVALPAGIIASGFHDALRQHNARYHPAPDTWRVAYRLPDRVVIVPVASEHEAHAQADAWKHSQLTPGSPGRLHDLNAATINLNAAWSVQVQRPGLHILDDEGLPVLS